jgi:hypothetical protein
MKSMDVLSARLNETSGRIEVIKAITNDDDTVEYNGHSFHPETPEWRAAELGLDNLDDAIEAVLFEPFIEPVEHLKMTTEEVRAEHLRRIGAAKAKLTRKNGRVSSAQAKQGLLQAGLPKVFVDASDRDPRQVIKEHCRFEDDVLDVKREYLDRLRKVEREKAVRPKQNKTRVEHIREQLTGSPKGSRLTPATSNGSKAVTRTSKSGTRGKAGGELPPIVLGN